MKESQVSSSKALIYANNGAMTQTMLDKMKLHNVHEKKKTAPNDSFMVSL